MSFYTCDFFPDRGCIDLIIINIVSIIVNILLIVGIEKVCEATVTLLRSGIPSGGVLGGSTPPPRNSEVLTRLSRIPSSVENTSVTT
jgi:hypothetical protein